MFSSSYRRAWCQDKNWNLFLAFFCMMCGDDDRKAIKTVIKLIGLNVKWCVLVHVYHTNKQTISKVSHLTWIGEMSYVAPEKSENGNLCLRIYCTHIYLLDTLYLFMSCYLKIIYSELIFNNPTPNPPSSSLNKKDNQRILIISKININLFYGTCRVLYWKAWSYSWHWHLNCVTDTASFFLR